MMLAPKAKAQSCSASSLLKRSTLPFENIVIKSCEEIKKSDQCQKVYKQIRDSGEDVSSRALRCETDFDASTYEKITVNYMGCLRGGIVNGFVEPIKSLGVWLGESTAKTVLSVEADANRQKNCDQISEHKSGLYKSYNDTVPTLLHLEIPAEKILAQKSCAQIEADLYQASKLKERIVSQKFDYKLIQKNPSMTEFEYEYLDWKKRKTEFAPKESQNFSEMADKLLLSYGIHMKCYNREAQAALQCQVYVMSASGGLLAREGTLKILAGIKNLEKTADLAKLVPFKNLKNTSIRRRMGTRNLRTYEAELNGKKVHVKASPSRADGVNDQRWDGLFDNEVRWTQQLSELGIGPKFYGTTITPDGHKAIITEFSNGFFYTYTSDFMFLPDNFKGTPALLENLKKIRETIKSREIGIKDIQLMIEDDRALVIDPELFFSNAKKNIPKTNLKTIDLLIDEISRRQGQNH